MPMYRKKPVVIEARKATGTPESNREIIDWTRGSATPASMDDHPERGNMLSITTLEGAHWVTPSDRAFWDRVCESLSTTADEYASSRQR